MKDAPDKPCNSFSSFCWRGASLAALALTMGLLVPSRITADNFYFVRSWDIGESLPTAGFAFDGRRSDGPILVRQDVNIDNVLVFDLEGTLVNTYDWPIMPPPPPLNNRGTGISVDVNGGYLVLTSTVINVQNQVATLDIDWNPGTILFDINPGAIELKQDPSTGDIFTLGRNTNVVHRYDSSGTLQNTIAYGGTGFARGIGFDSGAGHVLLADPEFVTNPELLAYAPDGTLMVTHNFLSVPEGCRADGIAYSAGDGHIFLQSDNPSHSVFEFAPCSSVDTVPPELSCPTDITVECAGPDGTIVEFTATASDNCDDAPAVTCTPASGSLFPLGSTTVTCKAEDASENISECSLVVTVEDTTAPSITCPSDVTLQAGGGGQATYTGPGATASDTCDPALVITSDPPLPATLSMGVHTITYTATDASNNSTQCTQTVTVIESAAVNWKICDTDGTGELNITDVVAYLNFAFVGSYDPECWGALDCNPDGTLDVTDAIASLDVQFVTGRPPKSFPFECGNYMTPTDPKADPPDTTPIPCVVSAGCTPPVPPPNLPDLIAIRRDGGIGAEGFCNREAGTGDLIIRVKNQGAADAGASTARVLFYYPGNVIGSTVDVPIAPIPAGGTFEATIPIPPECFNPDCDISIYIDVNLDVEESNESNNSAPGTCI